MFAGVVMAAATPPQQTDARLPRLPGARGSGAAARLHRRHGRGDPAGPELARERARVRRGVQQAQGAAGPARLQRRRHGPAAAHAGWRPAGSAICCTSARSPGRCVPLGSRRPVAWPLRRCARADRGRHGAAVPGAPARGADRAALCSPHSAVQCTRLQVLMPFARCHVLRPPPYYSRSAHGCVRLVLHRHGVAVYC